MSDNTKIVEVSLFGGRILVTFSDGMMAFLEAVQIHHLAVDAQTMMRLPLAEGLA